MLDVSLKGQRRRSTDTPRASSPSSPKPPAASGFGGRTFRSLRHRDFRVLWVGILIISSGQWLEQVAISWQVVKLTSEFYWVGVIAAARAAPTLLITPIGGVLADRYDRTRVLLLSQLGSALCAGVLASLGFTHTLALWHLIALSAGFGAMWSVNNPNRQALIPHLVPREDLMNAIALNSTGFNLTRTLGPVIGGALLAAAGFSWVFAMVCAA